MFQSEITSYSGSVFTMPYASLLVTVNSVFTMPYASFFVAVKSSFSEKEKGEYVNVTNYNNIVTI